MPAPRNQPSSRRQVVASAAVRTQGDLRADGRRKRRPSLATAQPGSIDAGAAFCLGNGRSNGMLSGRKETTRKLYRDAYEAFRRFAQDTGVDPTADGWERLPPNVLAAFYRWGLDHRSGGLTERTAATYAYAVSALLRQLLVEEQLPASLSLEKLRLGLRESLARGDYLRRKVDPRIDAFVQWVASQPLPASDGRRETARLEALRAQALVLTLYCSGLRREEVTALKQSRFLAALSLAKPTSAARVTASEPSFWTRRPWRPSPHMWTPAVPRTTGAGCSSRTAIGDDATTDSVRGRCGTSSSSWQGRPSKRPIQPSWA